MHLENERERNINEVAKNMCDFLSSLINQSKFRKETLSPQLISNVRLHLHQSNLSCSCNCTGGWRYGGEAQESQRSDGVFNPLM